MLASTKSIVCVMCAVFTLVSLGNSAVAKSVDLGGDFTLIDHNEQKFELKQLRGNVVLVFFGYTSCPDVCPTELAKMAQILAVFEQQPRGVKGLFISVDPERDSPEMLKQYINYFSPNVQGLTGSRDQIDRVTRLYQVNYQINQDATQRIVVDHSSNLYVIDKAGNLQTIIPFGMSVNHAVKVVEWMLQN